MILYKFQFLGKPYDCFYIQKGIEAVKVLRKLERSSTKVFGLDIETEKKPLTVELHKTQPQPGLDPHLSFVRLLQLFDGKAIYVFDMRRIRLDIFQEFFTLKQCIAHNGIFEIKHLTKAGLINLKIHCSMIMALMVDRAEHSPFEPNEVEEEEYEDEALHKLRRSKGMGLDAVMARLFNVRIGKHFQTSNWNAESLSKDQICYAGLDAVCTHMIGKTLFPKLKAYRMLRSYKVLKNMQHVIAEMETNGFPFDLKKHKKLVIKWTAEKAKALKRCEKFFGKINIRSTKQLGTWLKKTFKKRPLMLEAWPKSPSSTEDKPVYSFNRVLIYPMKNIPAIAAYLGFKKVDKLLNTYGETLSRRLHPTTGNLHCSFSLGETRTGRLSSFQPNLQQLPRDTDTEDLEIRDCFVARKGYALVVADFSQIEMRVAGELSRDKTMLKAFALGKDLHKLIVSKLIGTPFDQVTKEQRQLGKAVNFGLAFGMGARKLRSYAKMNYNSDLTEKEAYKAYNTYHRVQYPRYSEWCDEQRAHCEKLGFVRTPLGKMRKLESGETYTKAVNTPVQGGAAEVMFCAMIHLQKAIGDNPEISILSSVHDEVILETTLDRVSDVKKLLATSMKAGMLEVFPEAVTNGLTEVHSGSNWKEAKTGKPIKKEKQNGKLYEQRKHL